MAELHAVGFDFDGTLFDHRGSAGAAVDVFCRRFGVDPSEESRRIWFAAEDEHFERWRAGEISFQEQRRERVRLVLAAFGLLVPTSAVVLDELFAEYLQAYRAAWRPFADAVGVLRGLRASGYRVGILTNGADEQQLDKLAVIEVAGEVDVVCVSERIGVQKPEQGAFTALARGLSDAPAECLFIGDNAEHDVAGARAAGTRALLIDLYGEHADGIAAAVRDALSLR